ncbi:hypothetical protein K227x_10270 [Rubripirellula lacrimiformis]|uniref:DUF3805 domain-containing protein n=1 Tax=Rubripirellula lacrimiformis TaxID=1930273 RepID=A0A517N678_9BACT|nr:hypothetical protein [Rubripirellula lacrimiformis]QDT02649.1 hypothetical protein K227x_10270 [Rubripirellula lacrimiformis]
MPATFEALGLKFLYPDNWKIAERASDEGIEGTTFDLPTGGFFSIERARGLASNDELIENIQAAIAKEYGEVEVDPVEMDDALPGEQTVDFRFYYLDLVIVSRLMIARIDDWKFVIQMQAESRDFEANELVMAAILKQIRG